MATRAGALRAEHPFVLAWWLAVATVIGLVLAAGIVLGQAGPGAGRAPGNGVTTIQTDPGFGDPYQPQRVGGTICAQCR
jgi:hypothetical protein